METPLIRQIHQGADEVWRRRDAKEGSANVAHATLSVNRGRVCAQRLLCGAGVGDWRSEVRVAASWKIGRFALGF